MTPGRVEIKRSNIEIPMMWYWPMGSPRKKQQMLITSKHDIVIEAILVVIAEIG
jgi:hypothetical protein